jgi:Subtilase family
MLNPQTHAHISPRLRRFAPLLLLLGSCGVSCASNVPSQDNSISSADEYRTTLYLAGLNEDVTVIKTPQHMQVEFASGRRESLQSALKRDEEVAREAFGAMPPSLARELDGLAADELVDVAFIVRLPAPSKELGEALISRDDSTRLAAIEKFRAMASGPLARAESYLKQANLTVTAPATSGAPSPFVLAKGSPKALRVAAMNLQFSRVLGARHGTPVLHAGAKSGVSNIGIDRSFNAAGYYGRGQRIAHVEDNHASVRDTHEAFAFAEEDPISHYHVTYQEEPRKCNSSSDCNAWEYCDKIHPAMGSQCITRHASECMSVAAGSNGGKMWGAAQAHYYYPNGGSRYFSNMCDPDGTRSAYAWLAVNGVNNVNESFGCQAPTNGASLEGVVEDWYARRFDMFISKSAGNQDSGPSEAACPFSLNSLCVGAANASATGLSCYSSWTNLNGSGGKPSDREEPDVVAFGGNSRCGDGPGVDIMSRADDTSWITGDGTSYAAPAVVGLAALCREASNNTTSALGLRAIFKSAGWARNLADARYSMGTLGNDWRDGGGGLDAQPILDLCAGKTSATGPSGSVIQDDGKLVGSPWKGKDGCDACGQDSPPKVQSVHILSATSPGTNDGRLYRPLWNLKLRKGQRVRAVIAWNSCPDSDKGTAPAPIATDYDLFFTQANEKLIFSSQSVSDVTEGFDLEAPADDEFQLQVAFPEGAKGCDGTGFEPFAAAWWVWQ